MIGVFPTARCGGGSSSSPATVLRRRIGGVEGPGSYVRLGRSSRRGRSGRRRSGGAVPRRRQARRRCGGGAVVLWCLERETGECERRNRMRRTRQCSCAHQRREPGFPLSLPWRRRGGGHADGRGWRGEGRGDPARWKEGGMESGHDAWETTASRRWPAALHGGGRRRSAPAAEQAVGQGGGR